MATLRALLANKKKWLLLALAVLSVGSSAFLISHNSIGVEEDMIGGAGLSDGGQWVIYDKFDGYQTKSDPQKISAGANPVGQNTFINDGDRISNRDFGYELFPEGVERSTTSSPITSMHTFRKRDGTNILIAAYGEYLVYKHPDIDVVEVLNDGYTEGQQFGFSDHNTNVDQTSYVYFGNATESYSRWTGNVAILTEDVPVGTTTLSVNSTILFPATGTVRFCGEEHTYSGKTTTTITIATSTIACDTGRGVSQSVEEFSAAPKGNILMVLDTRMFVAGVASSTQTLFYSRLADASDFTYTVPRLATNGGVINMPEGGGGITGIVVDEGVLYVFKRNIIKSVTFTQDADDLPIVKPLKPHDNRSQTVGAVSQKSIFTGANGVFFVTPNNEIMSLQRVESVDYPQTIPISDTIKPTVNGLDFSSGTGVYWKNKAYFAAKTSASSTSNNVLLVFNTSRLAWESPILGFNIGDFSIANFNSEENLYFGDGTSPNLFRVTDEPLDDIYGLTSNWRSKEDTFGAPHLLKSVDSVYVEGYITDNTTLSISILLDEDGFTQTYTTEFVGTESTYVYSADSFNLFGFNPFGYERFGGNEDTTGKKKFRIYLSKSLRRVPFHSIQIEFASSGENQEWEILQYGYHIIPEPSQYPARLLRNFN